MADGITTNHGFTLPEVGLSKATWGTKLNNNWSALDAILNTNTGLFLARAGGTMVGQISLPNAPTVDAHAARKKYVDDQVATRLTQAAGDARYLRLSGGTMSGNIELGHSRIYGDSDTSESRGFTRKGYVDAQIATRISTADAAATYLSKGGDTMAGRLRIAPTSPNDANEATRKDYVDSLVNARVNSLSSNIAARLPLSGGTMTGSIEMGDRVVYSDIDTTNGRGYTRKSYVDTQVAARMTQAASDARYVNLSSTSSWGRSFINEANSADARATLAAVPTSRRVIPGAGLTLTSGTDNLGSDVNLRLGNPSSITSNSENTVTSTSHTHALGEATIRILIAEGASTNNIGTFVWAAKKTAGTVAYGATTPGSGLAPAAAGADAGTGGLTGTWRCLGYGVPNNGTLWIKIA